MIGGIADPSFSNMGSMIDQFGNVDSSGNIDDLTRRTGLELSKTVGPAAVSTGISLGTEGLQGILSQASWMSGLTRVNRMGLRELNPVSQVIYGSIVKFYGAEVAGEELGGDQAAEFVAGRMSPFLGNSKSAHL